MISNLLGSNNAKIDGTAITIIVPTYHKIFKIIKISIMKILPKLSYYINSTVITDTQWLSRMDNSCLIGLIYNTEPLRSIINNLK